MGLVARELWVPNQIEGTTLAAIRRADPYTANWSACERHPDPWFPESRHVAGLQELWP